MKTIALYDDDSFATEFTARVVSCEEAEGSYKIVLDQTLFFPEQGGQTSDIGILGQVSVTDVQIENEVIYHFCDKPIEVGQKVVGTIDWEHRFGNMQQHTGEHIFTGLAHKIFGADNVGFHLSDNTVTLDLNIELSEEQVRLIERTGNEIIAKDVPVKTYYPDEATLAATDYRSKKEIDGDVRLVEIEGVDICACCAPHVKTTGQVGMLKVVSYGKYKGGTRVYILCGLRALDDYNRRMEILAKSYQQLNCPEEDMPGRIAGILEDNKQLKYKISQIKADILMNQIVRFPSELSDVTIFTEDLDAKTMRDGVNALVERHEGLCAIFSGDDEEGYNFVIGSKTRDCSAIAVGLRELLGAKGGGSKEMAQGSIQATRSAIEQTL
ncbi:alanyl-tRNA editing protein [Pseudobutyrivibrio xylanivorans]|uniref:Alanyl-tRNA synthetase n=1 Tax=Pseudobutyrivibrio xylanivorans DSM 14809 TaxID=1123012 RepID=A0A1M6FG81_PSEXY|nr:alanine--tRNA ligase-related protein [Pseudobutyrivibrio xylanivorans]SHI96666.1 alanyl-tRNA synthetase [Pseudobutyrivibrio xylanivorans DSM 14809]